MNDSTMSTNRGNDANDGLTPQTPVATFARAKEILKANAKEKGDNIIYIMNGGTLGAGTSEVWSLEAFRTPCFPAISTAAPARPSGSRGN